MAHPSRGAYPQDVVAASLPLGLAGHDLIVQALVLCPTRELAEQVVQELRRLARTEESLKVLTLCGGTPGRLLDLIRRKSLKLAELNTLVFDEADRRLDMGFFNDIVALERAGCEKALAGAASEAMLYFSGTSRRSLHSLAWEGSADSMCSVVHGRRTRPT